MNFEILPPIEINGKISVVGITYDKEAGIIRINHHTRSVQDNKDQGDFKELSFDVKHLPLLSKRLGAYVENSNDNKG